MLKSHRQTFESGFWAFNADMFDPLINLRFSVRAATDGTNFYRKISKWRRSVFLFSLMGNSGSHHSLSLCRTGLKNGRFSPKWGFSTLWNGDGGGVTQHRCSVTFFFSFPLGRKKIQQQFDIWSCSVLWTVVHSLSLLFFSRLFSPFHFFLAPLIRERGGIVAAHLLSTALRLVDC